MAEILELGFLGYKNYFQTKNNKILKLTPNFEVLKIKLKFIKSDAQVGRVNTFHIFQTMRKGHLNFKLCMKSSLRFSNF
jgi:hypothetical protein